MTDELEHILELVSRGRLTPEEAAPIIEALTAANAQERPADPISRGHSRIDKALGRVNAVHGKVEGLRERLGAHGGRRLRVRVTERGRQVVNLNIPLGFVDAALGAVPGISSEQSDRIRQAVAAGQIGPILDVEDEDGDGVLIAVE